MTTENKAVENYGYILVDTPEKKAKYAPKLATDEVWFDTEKKWKKTPYPYEPFYDCDTYRRPVPIEPGYRLVGLDDRFSDGVQGFVDSWLDYPVDVSCCATPREHFAKHPDSAITCFRRKIESSSDGWVAITDRLPKADEYPVWVANGDEVEEAFEPYQNGDRRGRPCTPEGARTCFWDDGITHWMPKPKEVKPAPPKPTKSDEEVAFEKELEAAYNDLKPVDSSYAGVIKSTRAREVAQRFFNAGIAFAKSKQTK